VADILVSLSKAHLPKFIAAVTVALESDLIWPDAEDSRQV
jgi:hypothetical protein